MSSTAGKSLNDLEQEFLRNPMDIELLRELSSQYYAHGYFNNRVQPTYEKALIAAPHDPRFSQALNVTCFLRQLRRFTIESAEPELIDQEGLREAIALIQDYLKELPNSP